MDHRDTLAQNLQNLRRQRGLSLAELGRATRISSSFLSLVEQARSEISIGRLLRLADFYQVELTDLIGHGAAKPTGHVQVLRADSSTYLHSEQEGIDLYDFSLGTRWNMTGSLAVYAPGGAVDVDETPEHEVLIFVLDGTFEIAFRDEEPVRLERGEGAVYLATRNYRLTNAGDAEGRLLAVVLRQDLGRRPPRSQPAGRPGVIT